MEKGLIVKYAPVGMVLLTFVASMVTATAFIIRSIHGVETNLGNEIHAVESRLGARIECLEKDVAIIKTVMLMKGIMPSELALRSEE